MAPATPDGGTPGGGGPPSMRQSDLIRQARKGEPMSTPGGPSDNDPPDGFQKMGTESSHNMGGLYEEQKQPNDSHLNDLGFGGGGAGGAPSMGPRGGDAAAAH